jgi:hypothetical protein
MPEADDGVFGHLVQEQETISGSTTTLRRYFLGKERRPVTAELPEVS